MATRRESVILSLTDDFTPNAARAAAAARLLRDSVNDVDTTSRTASPAMARTSRDMDQLGSSARRSGPDIDRLSGRLGLARDAILTLGPALVPIGAVAIPAVVGLSAALGSAALAAGVAVGAFQGVGDAVKALSKADLEPTAENLQAAREALEDLSPATAGFVTQIHDLIPALKQVRDSAAEGLFPGLSQGIDDLERRLPIINRIAGSVGAALGGLAGDAGSSLSSGRWGPFLRFIEDEAPPAIESLGHIIGDLTHGVAELFMAFDPLSDGVIAALGRGADAFDKWAAGLSKTQGFQDFVNYVQESGPQVAEALGSIGNAVVKILTAVAPLGGDSLKIISTFADAVAAIAGSDIGGPLLIAAAAFASYNRAASLATSLSTRFSTGLSGLSAGGVIAGAAATLYALGSALTALESRTDRAVPGVETLTASLLDLGAATTAQDLASQVGNLSVELDALDADGVKGFSNSIAQMANDNEVLGSSLKALGALGFTTAQIVDPHAQQQLREAGDSIKAIDGALAGLVASAGPDRAKAAFQQLADAQHLTKEQTAQLLELLPGYRDALAGAGNDAKIAAEGVDAAAEATQRFSTALAELNGWLDKRAAIRAYRDDVKELANGLKDGFNRKDVEQIDKTAASIAKVASSIKDKGLRADFLAGARASLNQLAGESGPKARAEINKVIGKLDEFGLTHPPAPRLDADTAQANSKIKQIRNALGDLNGWRGGPTVTAQDAASTVIARIKSQLSSIPRSVRTDYYVNQINSANKRAANNADGGEIGGQRHPYGDKVLSWLAPGEQVISNRYGQADRFRADTAAGLIPAYAEGGETGPSKTKTPRRPRQGIIVSGDTEGDSLKGVLRNLNRELHGLERQVNAATASVDLNKDAVDRETSARDDLQSQFDSLSSSISGMFNSDLFGDSGGAFSGSAKGDPISVLLGDIANSQQFQSLFAGLQGAGLSGGALTAAAQGGIAGLQTVSAYTPEQIAQFQQLFDIREQQGAQTGQQVAQAQFGQSLDLANQKADQANALLAQSNALLAALNDKTQATTHEVKQVTDATKTLTSSAHKGQRNKPRGRR